jgi:hypothetical protein
MLRNVILGVITPLSMFAPFAAQAGDDGQFQDSPEHIKQWFKGLKSKRGTSCCSEADGHRTKYEVRGDTYWVPIEGKWYPIAPDIVVRNGGNPTEEGIVFYKLTWDDAEGGNRPMIFCFVPQDIY